MSENLKVLIEADAERVRAVGPNGSIDVSDDAATVIQSAVDALPKTGGRIDFSAGHYEVTAPIRVKDKHSVYFVGEGLGLDAYGDTSGGTTLEATGEHNILEWIGDEIKLRGGGTSYLHLKGAGTSSDAANLYQRGDTDRITHFQTESENAGYGCLVHGLADANHFINCGFQHNGIGLQFSGGTERYSAVYPKILAGEFSDNASTGISIEDANDPKIMGASAVRNTETGVELHGVRHAILSSFNVSGSDVGISCRESETGHQSAFVLVDSCALYSNTTGAAVEKAGPVLVTDSFVHHDSSDPDTERVQETGLRVGTGTEVLIDGCFLANDTTDLADPNENATVGTNL